MLSRIFFRLCDNLFIASKLQTNFLHFTRGDMTYRVSLSRIEWSSDNIVYIVIKVVDEFARWEYSESVDKLNNLFLPYQVRIVFGGGKLCFFWAL